MKANICVVGAGRLGAVNAAGLAEIGHNVHAVDINTTRIRSFQTGSIPFHEPGLREAVQTHLADGSLEFSTEVPAAVATADYVFFAVDTPPKADGSADLSNLIGAFESVLPHFRRGATAVVRSTVPPGTNARLTCALGEAAPGSAAAVVSNPEFLREGFAMKDFLRPERVVVGSRDRAAAESVAELYQPLGVPTLITGPETAEVIKYAANAFLAVSISFINEIANICESAGAVVDDVAAALKLDGRIGKQAYLSPGLGFGGGCLPKDLTALVHAALDRGYEPLLLQAANAVNDSQPQKLLDLLSLHSSGIRGSTIGVLGLSFKGGTFDLRGSAALKLAGLLRERGARVRAFDPLWEAEDASELGPGIALCADAYAACEGADAVVIATDHPEFAELDLHRLRSSMKGPVLIDGRYVIDPAKAAEAGLIYAAIGRTHT